MTTVTDPVPGLTTLQLLVTRELILNHAEPGDARLWRLLGVIDRALHARGEEVARDELA